MLRKNRVKDANDDDEYVKKSFFQRHPVLKWTLIGFAMGLFAAAIGLSLFVTLGMGIAPFIAIGTALGIANATAAATAGIGIVAGAATVIFGALFGGIAGLVNRHRAVKALAAEGKVVQPESVVVATVSAEPSNRAGNVQGLRLFDRAAMSAVEVADNPRARLRR